MSGPHAARHGASWAEQAERYDRMAEVMEPELRRVTDAMLDAVRAGPGARLLDLACGPGFTTDAARARGADALGLDATPAMVEVARRRFPQAGFVVGDMRAPPPGPWDAITCRFGAHHVEDDWAAAAWRALAPGGRIALGELGADGPAAWEKGMRPPSHWARLLEAAGFEDVTVATRTLHMTDLAARDPAYAALAKHGSPFRDGPVFVIAGRKGAGP